MINNLLINLQQELLDSKCDIVCALRKAHIIAVKLNLTEFDAWIMSELNGYGYENRMNAPSYRAVKGKLEALEPYTGWRSVQFKDSEMEKMVCENRLWQPVGELQELYTGNSDGIIRCYLSGEQANILSSMVHAQTQLEFAVCLSPHLLKSIIEIVKNNLLDWIIELEKETSFEVNATLDSEETKTEKITTQQVHYHGPVNYGTISDTCFVAGNNNEIIYNMRTIQDTIQEIKRAIERENISEKDKETAFDFLKDALNKSNKNKNPISIKRALYKLKDFLISVGCKITAELLNSKIEEMF